jgi:hypothetical protein
MEKLKQLELTCLEGVLTIAEVVEIYHRSKKRVRDLCLNGKLISRQSGSTWLISKVSCELLWGAK